jgi:hypothetical protein
MRAAVLRPTLGILSLVKAQRSRHPMSGLRAHVGGVTVRREVDPDQAFRQRLIDLWVRDYDAALKRDDYEQAARTATALREMGVRV